MANTDDIDRTVDELRNSVGSGAASNVDDILSEILGGDGAYSPGYHDMFSKYTAQVAEAAPEEATGLSGGAFPHRDYGAEADAALEADRRVESSISRKIAPSVRDAVRRESKDTQRPEYTVDGGVRYPSRGVGESGERVVYDADWEEEAKEEAARIAERTGAAPSHTPPASLPFRFTGADEPARPREPEPAPREPKKAAPGRAPAAEAPEAPAAEAAPVYFPEDFGTVRPAQPVPEPEPEPRQEEDRGLSPEAQRTVDSAVLEAFSADFDSDEAFKARWAETVERAERRKEQKAREAQEEEARLRSQKKLEEQRRRVAEMEERMKQNPPPPQKGTFSPPAPPAPTPEITEIPAAEQLDAETAEKAHAGTAAAEEKTIKKTRGEKFSFFMKTHFSKEGFKRFFRNTFPAKGDSGKEVVRKIVRVVSFIALVCGLVYLAFYYRNYRTRIDTDNEMGSEILEYPSLSDAELADTWADLKARYPDVDFPEGMNIKFAESYAVNQDLVGYLSIEERGGADEADAEKKTYRIRTVLLQSSAEDFYLYHDFYKKYSRYGNPYVMRGCTMGPGGLSKNTVVYGHNTHDHLIFNRLEDYMTVNGYLTAPVITLDTLYETTRWKIFAVMLTNADPEDNDGYVFDYLYSSFSSDQSFMNKMNQIKARSMIHTGVDVEPGDKTLMLYTCYRTRFDSGRLVIVARQLREGESEEIDTSKVYYDSSAIFPKAYYTGRTTTAAETTTKPGVSEPDVPTADAEDLTDATLNTAPPEEETPASAPENEAPPADEPAPDTPEEPAGGASAEETVAGD